MSTRLNKSLTLIQVSRLYDAISESTHRAPITDQGKCIVSLLSLIGLSWLETLELPDTPYGNLDTPQGRQETNGRRLDDYTFQARHLPAPEEHRFGRLVYDDTAIRNVTHAMLLEGHWGTPARHRCGRCSLSGTSCRIYRRRILADGEDTSCMECRGHFDDGNFGPCDAH
jgi:hypothetical protein